MFDEYHDAIHKEGLRGEFHYLDSSENFFWAPPGYAVALSYDSIRAILIQNDKALATAKLHWDTLQIFPLSSRLATYTGVVNCAMTDTSGATTNARVLESGVVVKRNDGWKLLSGQSLALQSE